MRLVCENHVTKAWPDECDCGPGMNDPVELLQESILGPRYHDKRTLMLFEAEYQARENPTIYWQSSMVITGKWPWREFAVIDGQLVEQHHAT